jgi:hypothetical protein
MRSAHRAAETPTNEPINGSNQVSHATGRNVYNGLTIPNFRKPIGQDTGRSVCSAAWRESDQQPYNSRRPILALPTLGRTTIAPAAKLRRGIGLRTLCAE